MMKIMFLNGGLANQMFQYIFYRYGEIKDPKGEWFLDDSFFFVNEVHNGYELEKVFGLHPRLLSEYFDKEVWDYMIEQKRKGLSIPEQLLKNGVDIRMISEYDNWKQWNPFTGRLDQLDQEFEDWMVHMEGNIYYNGYAIKSLYLKQIESEILREFTFPAISDERNREYMESIRGSNSCSLHVRRGDYVGLGVAARDEVYLAVIEELLNKEPDSVVFVFSDDISYCREHMKEMGLTLPSSVVFVEGNRGENAFRDMQLMSSCRNMIVGNSSFSFMASLLNRNINTILTFRKDRYCF